METTSLFLGHGPVRKPCTTTTTVGQSVEMEVACRTGSVGGD